MLHVIRYATFSFFMTICGAVYADHFNIPTSKTSYFQLDKKGGMVLNKVGLPIQGKSEEYIIRTSFSSEDTAFFVIDPWNNAPSGFLNNYYTSITNKYILPLIKEAAKKGFPIYIFTNSCTVGTLKQYSCSTPREFPALAKQYQNVKILFWQDIKNPAEFSEQLKKTGIRKIIYTGYASNMCVLSRPAGMFQMSQNGFSLYFVPKASAAVETKNTWKSGEIHKVATIIISQTLASLIKYRDIFLAVNGKGSVSNPG